VARGPLHQIAHRKSVWGAKSLAIMVLVCAGVLALNRTFFYNWWVGPVPFTNALALDPGLHRWARAEGPVVPTGLTRVAKVKWLKGLVQTERIADNYYAMLVDDRILIVRSESEMRGTPTLTGRLEELPGDVRNRLGVGEASKRLYPLMLDAEGDYSIWSANLFVLMFTPVTALAVLALLVAVGEIVRPHRSLMLRSLKTYGDPAAVTAEIDQELRSQAIDGRSGTVFLTRSWLIGLPRVLKLRDVIGIGFTPEKDGSWRITAWRRGDTFSQHVDAPEAEAKALLERLKTVRPGAIVTNVKAFEERWKQDQLGCEAAADASSGEGAAPTAPPAGAGPVVPPLPGQLPRSPGPARTA
jgi:hypothetical protein